MATQALNENPLPGWYGELTTILANDAIAAGDYLEDSDSEFASRTLIRTIFAEIEGVLYILKHRVLESSKDPAVPIRPTIAETAILQEKRFYLADNGDVKGINEHLRLSQNLKFTFKITAKILDLDYELPLNDAGWNAFVDSLKVRHRITHPKHVSDIRVGKDESNRALQASSWFMQCLKDLFSAPDCGNQGNQNEQDGIP